MRSIPTNFKVIGVFGLLPFLIGIIGTLNFQLLPDFFNNWLINLSLLYAGLILSFLGGCVFAFESLELEKPYLKRLVFSILPTLWALSALQLEHFKAGALAIGFLALYELDRKIARRKITPEWWLSLRLPLTTTVIISLAIIGFNA